MNTDERFAQTLSEWLVEEAAHRVPDHLAEVLVQTAATRQRPWWSSPERLHPMQTTLRLSPAPRLGLLVLIGLAILAALGIALLAVGSRNAPLAPVAGLARNGPLVYDKDGDIYRYDPMSGAHTLLVGGADSDTQPLFSRDGSRFIFSRRQGAGTAAVMVANADGSDIRKVIDEPTDWTWTDWSPDGAKIAFGVSTAGVPSVMLANADGSGARPLEVGMAASFPSWVGPDGTDILFRGEGPGGVGLFLV